MAEPELISSSNVAPIRALPANVEAEAAFLGAVLIDNRVIEELPTQLAPAHFFEPIHGKIYERILQLLDRKAIVTPVTLKPYFEADEALKELGGVTYLARLTADGQGLLAPRELAEQIYDLALLRELVSVGRNLVTGAMDTSESVEPLAQIELAEAALYAVAEGAGTNSEAQGFAVATRTALGMIEQALLSLRSTWGRLAQREAQARDRAVEVLQHAEQRNVLAQKIGREIESHADASRVPPVVIDFLCGPWAQVVAQARMAGASGAAVANKYQALISALLWSTHPELTRQNTAKLTRLVPLLLGTLREGLETISYPVTRTSAFLEALMGLHQMAFESARKPAGSAPVAPAVLPVPSPARAHGVEDGDPWVAPEEARTSNFMELPDMPPTAAEAAATELALGTWVELRINGQWMRTQLTWTSPHGTLFLFTSAVGTTQSMTRRSRDKLMAVGSLRIISGQPVVDGALDAVAQTAMRNSMDITL